MRSSLLYRIAAILLVLFAAGHTAGFRKTQPGWGVDPLVTSMRTARFDVQGFQRTYWDFYVGFGLFVSVFLLLAAILAWQLGGLPGQAVPRVRATAWALSLSFAAVTVLSWIYFFTIPIVFAGLITICLVSATWLSARPRQD